MNIPEELLKMSEKELQKILVPNIYRAKYIIHKNYVDKIHSVYKKDKRYFYINNYGERISRKDVEYYYNPLTYDKLKSVIQLSIYNSIDEWSNDKFKNWCIKQFISVFGEEYVDVDGSIVTVWFPEITIRNSVEQSHVIRDLYLRFYIYNNCVRLKGARRATMTEAEIRNNYQFSHMTYDLYSWEKTFCFGDTEIAILRNEVEYDRKSTFRNLSLFLLSIPYYLSWESLEGVPYRKIDDVICDNRRYRNADIPAYDINEIYNKVVEKLQNFTYDVSVDNKDEVNITISNSSIDEISDIITKEFPDVNCLYHPILRTSVTENNDIINVDKNALKFKFKDKEIEFTIIPPDPVSLPVRAHTSVVNNVINLIEIKFKEYYTNIKLNEFKSQL